jgi:PEP-CTERM motif
VKLRALFAMAVVLAMAPSAQAIQLVVMAVNNAPGLTGVNAGAKAFTIGVQITAADIAANPDSTLFVQNVSFTGAGSTVGPIQQGNTPDIQTAWTLVDSASPNSIGNGGSGGPSFPTSGGATTALYKDSWWYSGGTATLQGINGFLPDQSNDTFGVVTTVNSGQGVYAQGPGAAVGATGYLFQPEATGITGGVTSGSTMGFSGLFGPLGGNVLDQLPLSSQLVGGILTVPLAQIITKGDLTLPDAYTNGTGVFLAVGGTAYNYAGQPAAGHDGVATLHFATGNITFTPEPGTLVLAGMGVLGMLLAWRRRK